MEQEQLQTQQKRNKKPILFGIMMILVGVAIGGTFAYFTSSDTFENTFSTKPYVMEVTEQFESPTDWTPGTTTNKTVIATNKGDVDAAVRVHYTEEWKDANNQTLPLTQTVSGNTIRAAIINFADDYNTKWTTSTEDGVTYYYYKTKISKNQSTSSLLKSVQFNPDIPITTTDNCVDDATAHTRTCTTTTSGYAGGTYKLTVYVETVQHDQYKNAWGTNVTIN